MTAKEFIYNRSQELSEAIDNGYDLRLSEPDILYWMEKYADYKAKKLPIHNVSKRTFTSNCKEVEDVGERLHNFMDKHQLAKIGTFNQKLRMLVADIFNEYGC